MNAAEQKALEIAAPLAAYVLGLMFPAVPQVIWTTLFSALKSGDLDGAAIKIFLEEHHIQIYEEFPTGRNGQQS